jgi:hypothetical protein
MTASTVLDLGSTYTLSDYATRGITQTLDPIEASVGMRRTVNGALLNIAGTQFKKYRSVVSCADQVPPAFDGLWPGQSLTVKCIAELSYKTSGGSAARSVVSGSSRTEGSWTYYRPQLTMRVVRFTTTTNEWGAVVGWSLELEEV